MQGGCGADPCPGGQRLNGECVEHCRGWDCSRLHLFLGFLCQPVWSTEPWASCACLPKGIEAGGTGVFGDRGNMAGLCQRDPCSGELGLGPQARVPLGLLPGMQSGGDLGAP